ncbi:MAG: hypothetical protein ACUVTZ_01170 [Armatimonadota bacterium]
MNGNTVRWTVCVLLLAGLAVPTAAQTAAEPKLSDPAPITMAQWLEARIALDLQLLPYPYRCTVAVGEGPTVRIVFVQHSLTEVPASVQDAYRQAVVSAMRRHGFASFTSASVAFSSAERKGDRFALMAQSFTPTRRDWAELALYGALAASIAAEGRRLSGAVLPDGRVSLVLYDAPQSTGQPVLNRIADRVVQALSPFIPGFSRADITFTSGTTSAVTFSTPRR